MDVMTVAETLRVALNLIMLVQQAHTSGEPITKEQFDTAIGDRTAALSKLDHDIAAAREPAMASVAGSSALSDQPRNS